MGDDELVVLILSGWSDGPLPALEHSLRQRGLRCVRVPLPMPNIPGHLGAVVEAQQRVLELVSSAAREFFGKVFWGLLECPTARSRPWVARSRRSPTRAKSWKRSEGIC